MHLGNTSYIRLGKTTVNSDWDSGVVSEARPCPLALSKDVMVKCYWCESTNDALSGWSAESGRAACLA